MNIFWYNFDFFFILVNENRTEEDVTEIKDELIKEEDYFVENEWENEIEEDGDITMIYKDEVQTDFNEDFTNIKHQGELLLRSFGETEIESITLSDDDRVCSPPPPTPAVASTSSCDKLRKSEDEDEIKPVSYTHLTLPTKA